MATKTIAFDGSAGNGAIGTINLFTITGDVAISIFGLCSEDLVGATATIEVGVSGLTTACIAQTTATNLDNNLAWIDASPTHFETLPVTKIGRGKIVIATIATAAITDGTLNMYALWRPLSPGASVVAA